ncbi:preprotein translocase subunit SecE [Patescibacteria group bacterium]|nr:preprotein translocase subunit SecE [Patescibacteria group bacterium]
MLRFASQVKIFLQQVRGELKRVKWPTRKEIQRLTVVVIAVIIILGAYISLLDVALTKLIEIGIR